MINVGEKYGCLKILRQHPTKSANNHKFYVVECSRCGAVKKQRDDRIKKQPTHCGQRQCRVVNGVDIHERREIEHQLWCTIRDMKKRERPTWHYVYQVLKEDSRWSSTGIQNVNPLTMRKWFCRLKKQFQSIEGNNERF